MESEDPVDMLSESGTQNSDETIQNFVNSESSFQHSTLIQLNTSENSIGFHLSSSLQVTIPPSLNNFQDTQNTQSISLSHDSIMSTTNQTSSSQSNNWLNIAKLTSSSFFDWKRRLEMTLGARHLSTHILEEYTLPTESKAKADYIVNDLRALKSIQFSCDPDNFNVISECMTARRAYLALCKYNDDSGGVTTANLLLELANSILTSASELKDHLLQFRNTHTELKGNLRNTPNLRISDPFIAILLLKSLPTEFNSLVQTSLVNLENLTLDSVYALLNMEAKRLTGQSNESEAALATTSTRSAAKPKKR